MATRSMFILCLGSGVMLAACAVGSEGPGDEVTKGSLSAALGFDGPGHDVAAIEVSVYAGAVDCAEPGAEPVAVGTPAMEAEFLPLHLEVDPPGGDEHPFADALFVLAPGLYTACAVPLGEDGEPSTHCAATSGTAEVLAGQTTEILLYSQCLGDPTGALDVIVALNDPPHIDDLLIEPSKFITVCEEATFTALASDPNGDGLTYTWLIAQGDGPPLALSETGPTASITPPSAGAWSVTVIVDDGHGATASMNFPLHVSEAECGEPSCDDDSDCPPDAWCRPTPDPAFNACVPFATEGQSCGGFVQIFDVTLCSPELICTDVPPFIADLPGVCRLPCAGDQSCEPTSYCAPSNDVCREDGACFSDADCNAPGNLFPHIDCPGEGVCEGSSCGWECAPTVCTADLGPANCAATGGQFGQFGLLGSEFCLCRTGDFGASCTDGSDCEAQCIGGGADPACESATSGTCSEFVTTFGCFCVISGGQGFGLCVD